MAKAQGYPVYYGFNPPFFGGHQNVLSKQSGERIIKNDLMQLIMTSPGERVMRPDWGTVVKQSIFEQMTVATIRNITNNVNDAIRQFEPRIQVKVNVVSDPDNNLLKIILLGNYTNQPNLTFEQEIAIPLQTVGG